jgi:hypothetical protein
MVGQYAQANTGNSAIPHSDHHRRLVEPCGHSLGETALALGCFADSCGTVTEIVLLRFLDRLIDIAAGWWGWEGRFPFQNGLAALAKPQVGKNSVVSLANMPMEKTYLPGTFT